jgi:hypothetical protein
MLILIVIPHFQIIRAIIKDIIKSWILIIFIINSKVHFIFGIHFIFELNLILITHFFLLLLLILRTSILYYYTFQLFLFTDFEFALIYLNSPSPRIRVF